ncbi:Mu transposase C-terminal domain-containing protein [Dictyobacter arantiisoli]|uniref:Transposase n=1 Tax=Dictyobacter arantiisoli TaxID=2014874 RepID=A0A5A5TIG9_9CHLR|nr:Mu transposase C-terminal domain-containing protein [Dictyobacter arantiisoli]GCF11401.1 transposase [Dictyobacter arantiisoli]
MGDIPELLTEMSEQVRKEALTRYEIIRAYLEGDCSQVDLARCSGVPVKTLQRWVARYQAYGLRGLGRLQRSDKGTRRAMPQEQRLLIEGLALQPPRRSMATIHRLVCEASRQHGWPLPGYRRVCQIVRGVSPALLTLAHEGRVAHRETYDLLYRREASRPNEVWQADHYKLPIWLVNEQGHAARPWLTVILDDYSRVVVGYRLTWIAPTALHTALTLRQAILRKEDARWPVHGIPAKFYTDHGSDFTSAHLEQSAAELHMQVQFSERGNPRGRGKIERFFQTVEQLLLERLPGYAPKERGAKPDELDEARAKAARLSLAEFDYGFRTWLLEQYHQRPHRELRGTPLARWEEQGFVPLVPESPEQLDLLLLTVSKERRVQQDGIAFEGYRYMHSTLAAYVGEHVVIRYDPADMAEIRVYFQRRFLCRAICPELSDSAVSRAEIVAARKERRAWERGQLRERKAVVKRFGVKRPAELAGFENEWDRESDVFDSGEETLEVNELKRYEHE